MQKYYRHLTIPQVDKLWFQAEADHHKFSRLLEKAIRVKENGSASPNASLQPGLVWTIMPRADLRIDAWYLGYSATHVWDGSHFLVLLGRDLVRNTAVTHTIELMPPRLG